MNCLGSSDTWQWSLHLLVPDSLTCGRISHIVDQNFVPKIDHFVTILLHYSLCKMSKNDNTSPLFKILFFKNYSDLSKTDCFCIVQIKDSCIVDKESRRFYLLFLRLIWDLQRAWLQQKMLYLVLMHFIVELAQKWPREKDPLLHFIVDFARAAWLREQIFYCSTQTVIKFSKKDWELQRLVTLVYQLQLFFSMNL